MLSNYRLRELREQRERDAKQELEGTLAPVKAETVKALKRANTETRVYWCQGLAHLADCINSGIFAADFGVTYPSTDEKQGGARGRAQFEEFVNVTLPKRGFVLSESGSQRLLYFVLAQALSENKADMANPETWRIAFDRLYQLDCFDIAKAEVGYDESLREIVPEPVAPERKLTIDDLENIDTSTRSGAALAKTIIADSVFGFDGEARKMFNQFLAHVLKTFGVEMTPEAQKEMVIWFQRNNRSFLDPPAYDQCKVNLVRRSILPHTVLTEEEELCAQIENEDTLSWEGKRRLKQEILASRQPESL